MSAHRLRVDAGCAKKSASSPVASFTTAWAAAAQLNSQKLPYRSQVLVGKGNVLRIYPVVLEVLKQLQPALRRIEVQDRDLARQLRRASSSIALNLGEGMYRRGQNRHARYHTALGSVRETLSCLEVAALSSYVEEDKQLWDQLDRVVGTLVLLVRA